MIKIKEFGSFQVLQCLFATALDTFTPEQWEKFLSNFDIDYYSYFNEVEFVENCFKRIQDALTVKPEQEKAYELVDDFVCMVLNENSDDVKEMMMEYKELEGVEMSLDTLVDALEELKPDGTGSGI